MIPEIRNHSYHQQIKDLISSALYKEDCKDNKSKCSNTWIARLQPVQKGSSIMPLMTEQETMEQNLWQNISIHQLPNTFTQIKWQQPGMPYQMKL